jgi:hypothetical protein
MSKIELDLNGNARFICYASVTTPGSGVESRSGRLKMKMRTTVSNDVAMKPARLSGGGGRFKHTTAPLDHMARVFRSCLSRLPTPKPLPLWFHRGILSLRYGEQGKLAALPVIC